MKDIFGEIIRSTMSLVDEAWENGWLLYFLGILFIFLIILIIWNRDVFAPVNIFN